MELSVERAAELREVSEQLGCACGYGYAGPDRAVVG